jgi:hypothetical protein
MRPIQKRVVYPASGDVYSSHMLLKLSQSTEISDDY